MWYLVCFCRYEPNTIDLDQDEFKYSSISPIYRHIIAIESFDDIWDNCARYWFKVLSDHLPDLVDKVWSNSCKDIFMVPFVLVLTWCKICFLNVCMSFSLAHYNHREIRDCVSVLANLIRCISVSESEAMKWHIWYSQHRAVCNQISYGAEIVSPSIICYPVQVTF